MRVGILPAIVAAVALQAQAGLAACPGGRAGSCVNLDVVPQISQQVVAGERVTAPSNKPVPAVDAKVPYTGPTVGLTPTVHKAPTVGYRWAIN